MNTTEFLLADADGAASAWVGGAGDHTYAQLRAAVCTMMDRLAAENPPPGTPVAILAPNGMFWIASYLATMALGLIAVPMPTALDDDDVSARIAWAGCRIALLSRTRAPRSSTIAPGGVTVIAETELDDDWTRGHAEIVPTVPVAPDADAAYLFTSGTTGRPRVVRITHANIQANTASILAYLELRATDRMLVVLPFTYVFGASLLHTHLRAGASLVDHPGLAFPNTVVTALAEHRCTGFAGVPSAFNLLLRNSTFANRPLPDLRLIQQAGGALSPAVLRELVAAQPAARVLVMYGQTEATARLSYLPSDELLEHPGSIGRGIPGVMLEVIGDDGRPVAAGKIGEIHARGDNVSPGYLNDAEASTWKMPGGVLHTGDLATVDDEGYIYVVDRVEDFIKSWGYRIASADVEAGAMELSELVAAAAVGVADAAAGERIELVVVLRDGSTLTADDVLEHCRARLAKFMTPTRVHIVDALPVNANGKVVKREIRELCRRLSEPAPSPVAVAVSA